MSRVLVVDSDPSSRAAIVHALEPLTEVDQAANGVEALRLLAGKKFTLILLDLHVRIIDGFVILHTLGAKAGPNKDTPVYVMSADVSEHSRLRALREHAVFVLNKPVSISTVTNLVDAGLKKASMPPPEEREGRASTRPPPPPREEASTKPPSAPPKSAGPDPSPPGNGGRSLSPVPDSVPAAGRARSPSPPPGSNPGAASPRIPSPVPAPPAGSQGQNRTPVPGATMPPAGSPAKSQSLPAATPATSPAKSQSLPAATPTTIAPLPKNSVPPAPPSKPSQIKPTP